MGRLLFLPIVAILAVGLVALLLDKPLLGEDSSEEATMRLVYLAVLGAGILAAGAGRALLNEGWRTVHYGLVWSCVFAGLALSYSYKDELQRMLASVRGDLVPSVALSTARAETVLNRAWDGHYRADARINGVAIRLMVDTGASMVVIPHEQVAALGFDPAALDYSMPVMTANGRSTVAPIHIEEIRIGDIVVRDVAAAVAHPGKLQTGLLGMSFLDRLGETSFQGTKLYLRQALPEVGGQASGG